MLALVADEEVVVVIRICVQVLVNTWMIVYVRTNLLLNAATEDTERWWWRIVGAYGGLNDLLLAMALIVYILTIYEKQV